MDPAMAIEVQQLAEIRSLRHLEELGTSDIQKTLNGGVAFMTGATGFIGSQLIEKLFRSCREIKKMYVLIRQKKDKTIQERLDIVLQDPVFDELKKVFPNFAERIVPIQGDVMELGLGIKEADRQMITKEVTLIYHVAATVRFDEPLKVAVKTNVRGTRDIIRLARDCENIQSVVHVSTAYSHLCSDTTEVKEVFYDSPVPPETMIEMVENVSDERIDDITPSLIKGWPNTYAFSKALAEDIVRTTGQGLPICIVRPAIVMPTCREPTPGWLNLSNVTGPSGMILGNCLGVSRIAYLDVDAKLDFVPLDYVNNLIIAASYDTIERRKNGMEDIKIYTLSRFRNQVSWKSLSTAHENFFRRLVSPRTMWYVENNATKNVYLFMILHFFLHYLPSLVLDLLLKMKGNKLRPSRLYTKFYRLNLLLSYFLFHSWRIHDDNTLDLKKRLSKTDQKIFDFDIEYVDNKAFLTNCFIGIRKYVLKDGLKGTEEAIKRQFYYKYLHYAILCLYAFSLYKFFSFAFSCLVLGIGYVLSTFLVC